MARLKVKWNGGSNRVNYDAHKSGGAFAALIIFPVTITGAAMLFYEPVESAVNRLTNSDPPAAAPASNIPAVSVAPPTLDALLSNADQAMPGADTTYVYFPTAPDAVLIVTTGILSI